MVFTLFRLVRKVDPDGPGDQIFVLGAERYIRLLAIALLVFFGLTLNLTASLVWLFTAPKPP